MEHISNLENIRLLEDKKTGQWKKWGPYLSERQWGTVREDYSDNDDAWNYFPHDHARSRAYKWGEDGLAGISDDKQSLCFSIALWNGKDPILKERLFGLTNAEGNHGEDVKEYYFYLDNTPTHSYMKYLYKYPQKEFPYNELIKVNKQRSRNEKEYELLDTGVFNDNKYFDVFVEYAKNTPNDILIKITVHNRSNNPAKINVLPTLWHRNNWHYEDRNIEKPTIRQIYSSYKYSIVCTENYRIGKMYLITEGNGPLLFTDNETNTQKLFKTPNTSKFVKDGINDFIVNKKSASINPQLEGTKVASNNSLIIPAKGSKVIRLRLTNNISEEAIKTSNLPNPFGPEFDKIFSNRATESDIFYNDIIPSTLSKDHKMIMRQALSGMLWSKQFYYFDIDRWLNENDINPLLNRKTKSKRNIDWHHMYNKDIISMPDKWEYPWYATWDSAFHLASLSLVDTEFSKEQIRIFLKEEYMHPNGQLPAFEWNFSDTNPPVHAWATFLVYQIDKFKTGNPDISFLKTSFNKLLLNFTWWINRKDRTGNNLFEGGFLGLDNISVFDRNDTHLPTGGFLEQADATGWMALFCQNMLEMSIELSKHDKDYVDMLLKFSQHFLWMANSMTDPENDNGIWDEEDGFFYDIIRFDNGKSMKIKVRSVVGLLPLCAVSTFSIEETARYAKIHERLSKFMDARPEFAKRTHNPLDINDNGLRMASVLNKTNLIRVLKILLDENEFLSPYGIRSLSKVHKDHPYVLNVHGKEYRVDYLPGESNTDMFGGNSNWRGPIWMPMNTLVIRALLNYNLYYEDSLQVECPTGSGNMMNLKEVALFICDRLFKLFTKDAKGNRPSMDYGQFNNDPHWKDLLSFYEYFHGDTGEGLGASHQTGWTGGIARLIQISETLKQNSDKMYSRKGKNHFVSDLKK